MHVRIKIAQYYSRRFLGQCELVGFRDLVGVSIAPILKKTAVKFSNKPALVQVFWEGHKNLTQSSSRFGYFEATSKPWEI